MNRRKFLSGLFRRGNSENKENSGPCVFDQEEKHPEQAGSAQTPLNRTVTRQRWINKLTKSILIQAQLCVNSRGNALKDEECTDCINACPKQALEFTHNSSLPVLKTELCNECLDCIPICPSNAILDTRQLEITTDLSPDFDQSSFTLTQHKKT